MTLNQFKNKKIAVYVEAEEKETFINFCNKNNLNVYPYPENNISKLLASLTLPCCFAFKKSEQVLRFKGLQTASKESYQRQGYQIIHLKEMI